MDAEGIATLIVSGDVSLESDVSLILRPVPACYSSGTEYTLMTVGGDLEGEFSTIEAGSIFLTPTLVYTDEGIFLTVERNSVANFTTSGNDNVLAVAETIDQAFKQSGEAGSALGCAAIVKMFFASEQDIPSILNTMQPALFKGLTLSQENNAVKVRGTLSHRMQTVQDGRPCQVQNKPYHVWVDGFGDILRQNSLFYAGSPQTGYQTKTAGVVTGIDRQFYKYFYVGALGAYTGSKTHWTKTQGKGNISTGYGGLYFSALGDMFYANASVIGGWSHFSSHRNILFPLETVTANSSHGGSQLLSHLDTGIQFSFGGFTLRPFDSFDYVAQSEGSFTEAGGGGLDLKVDKSNAILLRNELGLQLVYCLLAHQKTWTISPKLSWVREVRVKGSSYTASFVEEDIPFQVTGYFPDRSLFSPGLIVSGNFFDDLLSVNLYYEGEFGNKYNDHNFGGQVRFGF